MSDEGQLAEAEIRLMRAFERLDKAMMAPSSAAGALAAVEAALADEKIVTAQLTERVAALKADLAAAEAQPAPAPVAEIEDLSGVVAERDAELAEVRGELERALQEINATAAGKDAEIAALRADLEGAAAGYAETLAMKEAELAAALAATAAPAQVIQAAPGDLAELTSLIDITAELRARASEGAADADLINRAMLAELEALRFARQADLAEVKTLLAELEPMLEESAHA